MFKVENAAKSNKTKTPQFNGPTISELPIDLTSESCLVYGQAGSLTGLTNQITLQIAKSKNKLTAIDITTCEFVDFADRFTAISYNHRNTVELLDTIIANNNGNTTLIIRNIEDSFYEGYEDSEDSEILSTIKSQLVKISKKSNTNLIVFTQQIKTFSMLSELFDNIENRVALYTPNKEYTKLALGITEDLNVFEREEYAGYFLNSKLFKPMKFAVGYANEEDIRTLVIVSTENWSDF